MGPFDTVLKDIQGSAVAIGRRNTSDLSPEAILSVQADLQSIANALGDLVDLLWPPYPT